MARRSFQPSAWRAEYTSETLGFLQAGFDFTVGNGFLMDDGEKSFLILQVLQGAQELFIFLQVKNNGLLFPFFIGYVLSMSFHG